MNVHKRARRADRLTYIRGAITGHTTVSYGAACNHVHALELIADRYARMLCMCKYGFTAEYNSSYDNGRAGPTTRAGCRRF